MSYIDVLREAPDIASPGLSACQGCGGELCMRKIMQIAGSNSIFAVPPGCMAGCGIDGWNYSNGVRAAIHITLLDNTASFLSGVSEMYQRKGRSDVNIVAIAGDGASADCGFQSLSGAAERGSKMLYVCYDNEGYMNTGFQRSSTTSLGSRTTTTPLGSVINGKEQHQKYLPLIMAMHNIEYCATASPSHMPDFVAKVQKGLEASKRGFAYLHVLAPCPTGWASPAEQSVSIARLAVKSNMFPLWEMDSQGLRLTENKAPAAVDEFAKQLGKFKKLSSEDLSAIQAMTDKRYETLRRLAGV